jgi:hypothetical protein
MCLAKRACLGGAWFQHFTGVVDFPHRENRLNIRTYVKILRARGSSLIAHTREGSAEE